MKLYRTCEDMHLKTFERGLPIDEYVFVAQNSLLVLLEVQFLTEDCTFLLPNGRLARRLRMYDQKRFLQDYDEVV
jgi:CRISPR/Cas system-associated endonuclease/helicase Cas3